MRLTPRQFVASIGAALLLAALLVLALPISVEDVSCGSGFAGLSDDAGLTDAGRTIGRAIGGDFTEPAMTLEGQCEDAISTRRAWGWSLGIAGLIATAGAALVQTPDKRSTPNDPPTVRP